jgi:hypothetical protein
MRRLSLSSLALLSLLGLAGCGDEEPIEPLADFRYTIGCGGRSGCFSKDRDINGFNNEGGVTVSCTAGSSAMGSTLAFRLSALDPVDMRTRFSIALSNVIWNESTGLPVGTSGQVTVTEGGNTYVGTVSGGTPSIEAPCQVSNLEKTMDEVGNPQIEGDILCGAQADKMIGLEQRGAMTIRRDLYVPESETGPAHFRIVLCDGLPIPE